MGEATITKNNTGTEALVSPVASPVLVNPPLLLKDKPEYSGVASISKVLLGLLLVIAVFLFSAWLLKRLQLGVNPQHSQMKTLAAMALTNRERVMLVEVAGVQMILGVAPGSVTALHVFDTPVVPTSDDQNAGFAGKLAQFMAVKHDKN